MSKVEKTLRYILYTLKQPLTLGNILGINLKGKIKSPNMHHMQILCVMTMKQVTQTWKQPNSPKLNSWQPAIEQILDMEKLDHIKNGIKFTPKVESVNEHMSI